MGERESFKRDGEGARGVVAGGLTGRMVEEPRRHRFKALLNRKHKIRWDR